MANSQAQFFPPPLRFRANQVTPWALRSEVAINLPGGVPPFHVGCLFRIRDLLQDKRLARVTSGNPYLPRCLAHMRRRFSSVNKQAFLALIFQKLEITGPGFRGQWNVCFLS
jgi:hypothetical protein